jgi:CxxC motif-containing protein (DUF1111 family)
MLVDFHFQFHYSSGQMDSRNLWLSSLLAAALAACSSSPDAPSPDSPASSLRTVKDDPTDLPLLTATAAQLDRFAEGDGHFDHTFSEAEGLGPLYIRTSCGACHATALKGPGAVQKMAVVEADGVTPRADQSELPYGPTVRPYAIAGVALPLLPPSDGADVKVTVRIPPSVMGRGYMEAITDAEIERVEAEQGQRADGIHGRINRVTYGSEANGETEFHAHKKGDTGLIGRFGLKARIATLDEFTADAYQGDMNITSPMRPVEVSNPDGKTDDGKPGLDIDLATVNAVGDYMRLVELPSRAEPTAAQRALFEQAMCGACHVPSLKTRADYPIAQLAGIDAPVYTDMLLHDMGDALADGQTDQSATSREWRTAPLIGLRFFRNFMHDGRAKSVEQAIEMHEGQGSQASGSVAAFRALSGADRASLLAFVQSL